MSDHTELEAARFVRAALELIRDALPFGDVREHVTSYMVDMDSQVDARESDAPPWTPERPETDIPWSAVLCGDEVLAPNGQWYEVASNVELSPNRGGFTGNCLVGLIMGEQVPTFRYANKHTVRVRRGPTGQAADMFTNAGLSLEVLAA